MTKRMICYSLPHFLYTLCVFLVFSSISNVSAQQWAELYSNDTIYACTNGTTQFYVDYFDITIQNPNYCCSTSETVSNITGLPSNLFTQVSHGSFYVKLAVNPTQAGAFPMSVTIDAMIGDYTLVDTNGILIMMPISNTVDFVLVVYDDTISATIVDAACGQANGSIALSLSGLGSPPTYSWSSGQTSSSLNNLGAGAYSVSITDFYGCLVDTSYTVGGFAFYADANTICTGGSVQLSIINPAAGTTFTWQESTNGGSTWTDIAGYTNTLLTSYTTPALIASQSYQVLYTDTICSVSPVIDINVVPVPTLTLSASNDTVCQYDEVQLYANAIGATGSFSYQWQSYDYFNNMWQILGDSAHLTVYPDSTQNYQVLVNTMGAVCNVTIDSIAVAVKLVDVTVTQSGASLIANATNATYQWVDFNTGLDINGATQQIFTPTTNGYYGVKVTQNGCTQYSDYYEVTNVGINESDLSHHIKAYPNPNQGTLNIDFGNEYTSGEVTISALIGQMMIKEQYSHAQQIQVNMPNIAGIYFVTIRLATGESSTLKVIRE